MPRQRAEYDLQDLSKLIGEIESVKRREQLTGLFRHIEKHCDLSKLPASCYMHGSYEGGCVDHSVRVTKVALELRPIVAPLISKDSIITVGLCHDLSKIGFVTKNGIVPRYLRNQNFDPNQFPSRNNRPWFYNSSQIQFPLAVSTAIIAAKWTDLTWAELQAITAHDGQYCEQNKPFSHHETPLTLLITMADTWSGHVIEGCIDQNQFNKESDLLSVNESYGGDEHRNNNSSET